MTEVDSKRRRSQNERARLSRNRRASGDKVVPVLLNRAFGRWAVLAGYVKPDREDDLKAWADVVRLIIERTMAGPLPDNLSRVTGFDVLSPKLERKFYDENRG